MAQTFLVCKKCGNELPKKKFIATTNPFFPNGYSDICINCIYDMVDIKSLVEINKLFQWLDIPFNPNLWTNIYKQAPNRAIQEYLTCVGTEYQGCDWLEINDEWQKYLDNQTAYLEIDSLKEKHIEELHYKYGDTNYKLTEWDLRYLEEQYNGLIQTYAINTAMQKENAVQVSLLSLRVRQATNKSEPKELEQYIRARKILMENSGFDPDTANHPQGGINDISTFIQFVQKHGKKDDYKVEAPKDIVDTILEEVEKGTRRSVLANPEEFSEAVLQIIQAEKTLEKEGIEKALDDFAEKKITDEELFDRTIEEDDGDILGEDDGENISIFKE